MQVTTQRYEEKVYAGVLGKLIGVYLGRPFEQWTNERIERELGEITGYVHEKRETMLVVTDDDITGTFTFLRALAENDYDPNLTPAQIGDWWRNSIIEGKTILWWGGFGVSTEHTAFLRLKDGLKAPASGLIATNGVPVAEEIGAQIFIDGWGLIWPGDPAKAADWARRAASVSHDGEAIYGAQIVAALVALAFTETELPAMLGIAAGFVPPDSLVFRLVQDMMRWKAAHGDDWRATLAQIHAHYPYSRFGTACPMVSNHAVVLLALLHGNGDFSRSLMIANTAGYDTDCNSGNVGCILGVMNGLAGIDAGETDWRGPVADRLFLPAAQGGRAITDALSEAYEIVGTARVMHGEPKALPKNGARFHFSLPGSVQGWQGDGVSVSNNGSALALRWTGTEGGRAGTATYIPPSAIRMPGYELMASPRLYSGQTVTASVSVPVGGSGGVTAGLYVAVYAAENKTVLRHGPAVRVAPGESAALTFAVPDTDGQPIHEVGVALSEASAEGGTLTVDRLTWDGVPAMQWKQPADDGEMWTRTWVIGADLFHPGWASPGWTFRSVQNSGTGVITQGETAWRDYTVSAEVLPHLADRAGLVAAARGLRRYLALVLDRDGRVRLVRRHDDAETVLAESGAVWTREQPMSLSLSVSDGAITATVDGETITAPADGLPVNGAVGFLVERGHAEWRNVAIAPA